MTAAPERHLLVDGSNIVHAWPQLREVLARDRDASRSQLCASMAALHDSAGLRVTVVFDGRGRDLSVENPSGRPGLAVVHTPSGTTADDVLERMVGASREPGLCIVATDDRALRQTVEALGASGMSADDLSAWIARIGGAGSEQLRGRRRGNDRAWRAGPRDGG